MKLALVGASSRLELGGRWGTCGLTEASPPRERSNRSWMPRLQGPLAPTFYELSNLPFPKEEEREILLSHRTGPSNSKTELVFTAANLECSG